MGKKKHKRVRAVQEHKPMSRSASILLSLALTSPAILYWASSGDLILSIGMIAVAVWFGVESSKDGSGNGEGAPHWDQGV